MYLTGMTDFEILKGATARMSVWVLILHKHKMNLLTIRKVVSCFKVEWAGIAKYVFLSRADVFLANSNTCIRIGDGPAKKCWLLR